MIGKKYTRARSDLMKRVAGIANVANVPEIQAQSDLIGQILHTDYIANAGINEFEEIRERLRDVMKYILKTKLLYNTNFDDDLLSIDWRESELENDELKNYKAKMCIRDRLYSTGIRVGELVNLNIDDIDFEGRECVVYGKGDKERRVYFDAKAKVHLKEYIDNRTDNNSALFVTLDAPYDRLKISGVEIRLRKRCV